MHKILIIAAAAFAACLPGAAQSLTANTALAEPTRVVKSVTLEDLKAIVAAEGHKIDNVNDIADLSVRGITDEGLIFNLIGQVCDEPDIPGCLGIEMQVRYDTDDAVTLAKINEANLTYAAAKVWMDEDIETWAVSHYVILDGGQSMDNVRIILRNVLDLAENVSGLIWPDDAE